MKNILFFVSKSKKCSRRFYFFNLNIKWNKVLILWIKSLKSDISLVFKGKSFI